MWWLRSVANCWPMGALGSSRSNRRPATATAPRSRLPRWRAASSSSRTAARKASPLASGTPAPPPCCAVCSKPPMSWSSNSARPPLRGAAWTTTAWPGSTPGSCTARPRRTGRSVRRRRCPGWTSWCRSPTTAAPCCCSVRWPPRSTAASAPGRGSGWTSPCSARPSPCRTTRWPTSTGPTSGGTTSSAPRCRRCAPKVPGTPGSSRYAAGSAPMPRHLPRNTASSAPPTAAWRWGRASRTPCDALTRRPVSTVTRPTPIRSPSARIWAPS